MNNSLTQEIHDTNIKIKEKVPVIFIYLLVLVIIFQAGIATGIFLTIEYTKSQIKDAISAEAFVYNNFDKGKFTNKKVMYTIRKYEVIEEIHRDSSLPKPQK